MLSADDLAWCAGLIDSMGSIKTRPMSTGSELTYVAISSPRLDLLDIMADLTGTSVVTVKRDYKRLGCGEHCTEAHQHVLSVTGRWSLTGAKATVFLAAIEPYLRTKKEEVRAALDLGMDAPVKPATLKKMYDLGWPPVEEA